MSLAPVDSHPYTIFVTNLFDMPHYVREFSPARLVSIIQPELQPARPAEIEEDFHLRISVHDIIEPVPEQILLETPHITKLLSFIDAWDPSAGALLTHCYAGVSRSTATALIAAYMKTGDAVASAKSLRRAAPHAIPNLRLIELADRLLGCQGDLITAREAMGGASACVEALTILRLTNANSG